MATVSRRALAAGSFVVAGALALTACGGGGGETGATPAATGATSAAPSAQNTLAAMVPDAIKSDGKLIVGVDASYPPNESVDPASQKIVGWDVELVEAIAGKLGLTAEFQNAGFDTIIPGLQSGKYELGASSFTDNKEREKVVDFVTYYSAGTAWAALKGNPKGSTPRTPAARRSASSRAPSRWTTSRPRATRASRPASPPSTRSCASSRPRSTPTWCPARSTACSPTRPSSATR
ncbi:transporter substrate-binding domain-containing protein [Nonomuraea recticatena]|uniref:transporter substrate-binding domain-containing protein n=1 Tax=Nonomuraea recticatena TaxID=46178 RepID=UPI003614D6AE